MAKSDLTLFGILARYSPFWIIKIKAILHLNSIIYKSICSCAAVYIGETIRNVNTRWNEHEIEINKNSNWFKHYLEHLSHDFQWSVLSIAPSITCKWQTLEACFIKIMEPLLNSQVVVMY